MNSKKSAKDYVSDWVTRAYALGVTFLALGVIGLLLSAILPNGILTAALENIAAVTFGIGLISFPYEIFLRRKLSNEILTAVADQATPILKAVQLDATLRASGLTGVRDQPVDWDAFFEGTKTIRFVPDSPTDAWLNSIEWKAALEAGKRGSVEIEVFIPKPVGAGIPALAKRLDLTEAETGNRLEELQLKISEAWNNAKRTTPSLSPGCRLRVSHYEGFPSVGLVYCDHRWVIQMNSIVGAPNSTRPITFEIGEGTDSFLADWLTTQLNLDGLGPIFENLVE
jgi:hypothetical protein